MSLYVSDILRQRDGTGEEGAENLKSEWDNYYPYARNRVKAYILGEYHIE